jgi:hypothetical protein
MSFMNREDEIIRQLRLLVNAQGHTNSLLSTLIQQEIKMASALEQAFTDFDAEITTIGNDIADLVKRLAAQPPGPNSDQLAAQIEQRIATLKAAADPIKQVALPPQATPTPDTTPLQPSPEPGAPTPSTTP